MKNWCLGVLAWALMSPMAAQAQMGQQGQAPPTVAAFVRQLYMGNQRNIVASGNKMPEEFFGLRPGPQMEVRTFGQHLAPRGHATISCGARRPRARKIPTRARISRKS